MQGTVGQLYVVQSQKVACDVETCYLGIRLVLFSIYGPFGKYNSAGGKLLLEEASAT